MADRIIGTAGVFFSLVLIAVASFAVGLVVFCVGDFLKTTRTRSRHRRHGPQNGPITLSAVTLASHVHNAAAQAARALLRSLPPGAADAEIRVRLEFACALLRMLDVHLAQRLGSHYTETYARTLEDVCAGSLYRADTGRSDVPLQSLLVTRLAEYRSDTHPPPDLLAGAAALSERVAARLASALPGADAEHLRANTSELLRSAVTLDLRPHLTWE